MMMIISDMKRVPRWRSFRRRVIETALEDDPEKDRPPASVRMLVKAARLTCKRSSAGFEPKTHLAVRNDTPDGYYPKHMPVPYRLLNQPFVKYLSG